MNTLMIEALQEVFPKLQKRTGYPPGITCAFNTVWGELPSGEWVVLMLDLDWQVAGIYQNGKICSIGCDRTAEQALLRLKQKWEQQQLQDHAAVNPDGSLNDLKE